MDLEVLTVEKTRAFREVVYGHFEKYGRDLPWRKTTDRYEVMVSEVMLQQTQVQRVVEIYPKFIKQFPTVSKLSGVPLGSVMRAWSGLGYNKRANYLWQAAKIVMAENDGVIPATVEDLDRLPGIGRNTASAILAFADDLPVVFIETNIRSVMLYHFFPDETAVADQELLPVIELTLDRTQPRRWYNALMDYGSWLKQKHPNPSRQSAHYKQQAPFAGSNRQIRGAVINLLRRQAATQREITRWVRSDALTIRPVLQQLLREGLIKKNGKWYQLP
jgi:A/G-specific adenine glycosylase